MRLLSVFLAGLLAWAPISDAALKGIATPSVVTVGASQTVTVVGQSYAAATAPADTNEDTLATVAVAGGAVGANGALRIKVAMTVTNNANVKTFRIRLGGTQLLSFNMASVAGDTFMVIVANRGATNSQFITAQIAAVAGSPSEQAYATAAVDTSTAQNLTITAQKATSTDTVTLEGYTVEVIKP